jgi:hypothetical protein
MSDYGADKKPDLNIASQQAIVEKLAPLAKVNVMQWTYPNGTVVRKYASKQGKSNLLVKFE